MYTWDMYSNPSMVRCASSDPGCMHSTPSMVMTLQPSIGKCHCRDWSAQRDEPYTVNPNLLTLTLALIGSRDWFHPRRKASRNESSAPTLRWGAGTGLGAWVGLSSYLDSVAVIRVRTRVRVKAMV